MRSAQGERTYNLYGSFRLRVVCGGNVDLKVELRMCGLSGRRKAGDLRCCLCAGRGKTDLRRYRGGLGSESALFIVVLKAGYEGGLVTSTVEIR